MKENNFALYLNNNIDVVDKAIIKFLDKYKVQTGRKTGLVDKYIDVFSNACDGGKRIRAILVKLGYELFGGCETEKIINPSIAFEIFQTGILIHDDIIDKSQTRRGKPTVHVALGEDHHAISNSICLGDISFPMAYSLINNADFEQEKTNKALNCFSDTITNTIIGEIIDVDLSHDGTDEEKDIMDMYILKTSYYTFIGPMQVGAALAGANEGYLKKIEEFGKLLGIIYQVQDDILGIFGEEKTIGKSITSDIQEGKSTILSLYMKKHANSIQQKIIDDIYGVDRHISMEEVDKIRKVMCDTGALKYAEGMVNSYAEKATELIPEVCINERSQELLVDMLQYLTERKK